MIYKIENEILSVDINSLGAEPWSIKDNRTGIEHLWQGDSDHWSGKAPNLFPICGHVNNDNIVIDGKNYTLTSHGFLKSNEHQVIEQTSTMIRFRLTENTETLKAYPFKFCVDTIFKINNDTLSQTFEVTNTNDCELPFSIGYHTGFTCAFKNNGPCSDYAIKFEQNETDANAFPLGNYPVKHQYKLENSNTIELYDDLFLPSIGMMNLKSKWVQLEEKATGHAIRVNIEGFPLVVFWSTAKDVPFVCIEPWYANFEPDENYGEFKNRPGLVHLPMNETFTCSIKINPIIPN